MTRKTILQLRDGDCRFPMTDSPPHLFCAELTVGDHTSYCARHHRICHAGFGKDPRSLEEMIYGIENTVLRRRVVDDGTTAVPVDVAVRG